MKPAYHHLGTAQTAGGCLCLDVPGYVLRATCMPRRAQQVAALVIVLGVLIADATSQYTYSRKVSGKRSLARCLT